MTLFRTVGSTTNATTTVAFSSTYNSCSSPNKLRLFNNISLGSFNFRLNSVHHTLQKSVRAIGMEQTPSSQTKFVNFDNSANLVKNKMETNDGFLASSAVAEFKGPAIFGVVRLSQVDVEFAMIEANFSGLAPGKRGWSINEFGDVTKGAASTGKVYNPTNYDKEPLGDLETLDVGDNGDAVFCGVKRKLIVGDLIGRSIVVYGGEDRSSEVGLVAAVIARSAGIEGSNNNKLCACDGTAVWEANNVAVSCPRL